MMLKMKKLSAKVNIGVCLVGLVMILLIIPGFFTLHPKTEKHPTKTTVSQAKNTKKAKKKANTQPKKTPALTSNNWTSIPRRAVALKNLNTYTDAALTHKKAVLSAKTHLKITQLTKQAFKLSNGTYISTDKSQVGSDVVAKYVSTSLTAYVTSATQKTNLFYSPCTTFNPEILTTLTGQQTLRIDKSAQTVWGTYYEVALSNGLKGWVAATDISLENPKLQQVQKLLLQKYNKPNYSIYVKLLNSSFTAGVNQNKKMYSASLSKIPILYWTQKQINNGYANLSDQILYSSVINSFYGSYKPAGTGNLPKVADNKVYSLQDIINRTAKLSDNVGSNMLSYYETGQFSTSYQKEITAIAGQRWDPKKRQASAQMVGCVLEALYGQGGACFDALFNTDFDNIKIKAGLPKNIAVAHKIGDADSENHDAAIVFAAQPYILVIETDGGSNQQIQQISHDVYEVLK